MRRFVRWPATACLLLLLIYVGLSFLNDTHGYLGDTGAKVATLRAMEDHGGLNPDVGYWAARWDREGRLHPLFHTNHIGAKWVTVTTVPALYAAYPLFRLGGYRGALLVPMFGSVLAALAARALARRLGGGDGWLAFWVVGLASPMTVYALDFWEHSLGVALIAWAVVLLLDLAEGNGRWFVPLSAGLLFGTAATMRTEALVYAAVATAVVALVLLVRDHQLGAAVLSGLAVTLGMTLPLAGNAALEKATVGSGIRTERTARTIETAIRAGGESRAEEAALTAVGFDPRFSTSTYLGGAVALLLLVMIGLRSFPATPDARPVAIAVAGVAVLYVLRFSRGLGFVPGLVAATPLAAIGIARCWGSPRARIVGIIGLAALPVVWATQYTGGAGPQWAGRYILPSGLLLAVAGVAALPRLQRWVGAGLVTVAAAVTIFGVAWLSQRSHGVGRSAEALARRPEPVLISRLAFLAREGGWYVNDRRWLTAVTDNDVSRGARIVEDAGLEAFGLVELEDVAKPTSVPGFTPSGTDQVEFVAGVQLRVTTFVRNR